MKPTKTILANADKVTIRTAIRLLKDHADEIEHGSLDVNNHFAGSHDDWLEIEEYRKTAKDLKDMVG